MRFTTHHRLATIALSALFALAACGDDATGDPRDIGDDTSHGAATDPADDACEHAQEGPFVEVASTATADDAPEVDEEHTAFELTLLDADDGTYSGNVAYSPAEAGDHVVFLSDPSANVTLTDGAGAEIAAEETEAIGDEHCVEINKGLTFDLEADTTYTLAIGSTDPIVTIVVVHAGDHAHE